jgi:aspartate racemase
MARHGIEVVVPDSDDRGVVHDVIFNELCQGQVRDASRARYLAIIEAARARGIDSVILGCTEISLLVDPATLPLPGYDSTAIHADAAVRFALADEMERAA